MRIFLLFLEHRIFSLHPGVSLVSILHDHGHSVLQTSGNHVTFQHFFHLFFGLQVLTYQLVSVVSSLSLLLHPLPRLAPSPPSQPLFHQKLIQSFTLDISPILQLVLISFTIHGFSTYHLLHSQFCSLQLSFIFYSQYET